MASLYFRRTRLLVNSALAALLEFKVLDCVRNVNVRAVDLGIFQGAIKDFAGRTDKRMPPLILLVSRLFADEKKACLRPAFTEYGLRRTQVEIAASAVLYRGSKDRETAFLRNESGGAFKDD